jgi:hypothetical protein
MPVTMLSLSVSIIIEWLPTAVNAPISAAGTVPVAKVTSSSGSVRRFEDTTLSGADMRPTTTVTAPSVAGTWIRSPSWRRST